MPIPKPMLLTYLALIAMAAAMPFDLQIMQYVNAHADCRSFFDAITDIGLSKWYTVPTGIISIVGFILLHHFCPMSWRGGEMTIYKIWHAAILIFLSVAGAGLFTDILKRIFARARPVEFLQHGIYGFFHWHEVFGPHTYHFQSFPSGHTTTMASLATAIVLMLPEKYHWARIPVFVFTGLIAASRIMVCAHYPSDVIAGAIIGAWGAVLARGYLARAKWAAAISRPAILQ